MSDDPIQCPECSAKPPFVVFCTTSEYEQRVDQGIRYKRRKCKECGTQWNITELTTERLDELSTTIEELTEQLEQVDRKLLIERHKRKKDVRIALTVMKPVLESSALRFKHPILHERLRKAADLLIHRNEEDNGL